MSPVVGASSAGATTDIIQNILKTHADSTSEMCSSSPMLVSPLLYTGEPLVFGDKEAHVDFAMMTRMPEMTWKNDPFHPQPPQRAAVINRPRP